jgi:hypothetical protein
MVQEVGMRTWVDVSVKAEERTEVEVEEGAGVEFEALAWLTARMALPAHSTCVFSVDEA